MQALQAGLVELRNWVAYMGGEWCCSPDEAESAIERITQAARYLVQVRGRDASCVYIGWGLGGSRSVVRDHI